MTGMPAPGRCGHASAIGDAPYSRLPSRPTFGAAQASRHPSFEGAAPPYSRHPSFEAPPYSLRPTLGLCLGTCAVGGYRHPMTTFVPLRIISSGDNTGLLRCPAAPEIGSRLRPLNV